MSIANTFPVFEADQVLTNKHLNDLFNYLDEQDRLTRCKLLGSGIVCGLEISHTNDTINITKGCGLTSQGYIILLCDHVGENSYKYSMPYNEHVFPADLELISQCSDPATSSIPFFSSNTANGQDDILLLLTQADFDSLTDNSQASLLSQAGDLSKYAVVLFLDVNELALKNCDTNDCNDKGSVMDLEVKALLVNKNLLPGNGNGNNNNLKFTEIKLRRYNVPVSNLNSSDDVLNAFVNLLNSDSVLDNLANDLNFSFITYKSLLSGINNYSFGTGADFKKALQIIQQSFPIFIQYYYDFIYDLIKAVYEFRYRAHEITSECCGDEMRFPFHLSLGEATTSTSNVQSAYRQYFIYSPLFDPQSQGANELRSLLMRLILMHQGFLLTAKSLKKGLPQNIKITPSTWGRTFISERCIPYYYKVVHDNTDVIQEDLYYYWNYDKTIRGNAKWNLSYNPTPYNTSNSIVNPLFYDIEWYDFFRIEGHIGKPVATVLSDLISKKQTFNLPFDVIALSADYIGALLNGNDPQCVIQDLESDYRILIAEFICKLHDGFCTAAKQQYTPSVFVVQPPPSAKKASKKTATKAAPGATAANVVPTAEMININIVADHPFISTLVNEFQAIKSYTKGDTLSKLCSPPNSSFGNYYITSIKSNNGNFVNPDPGSDLNTAVFTFIDSVESMLQMLMTKDLSSIDPSAFKLLYAVYEREVTKLKNILLPLIGQIENKENNTAFDYLPDFFIDTVQTILTTCIVEKLEALKNEYLRRVAQYRLAKNFNYYFKKHGGIEHKAGVPRAGTFILVYHEERNNRFVDVRSIFINQELSDTLLTNFRELLQPDVDLDTLEAQTKMLAVSTLYKDPDLYLRFKNVMQQYLDNCNDIPPDKKQQITTIINQPPAPPTYQLTDGMVIADFYVPYMCCSDCLPIAYILPQPATPPPLSVSQSDPECDAKGENFTVTLTVTGGTPPYSFSVNNAAVASNQITLTSGTPDTVVTITDAANQTTTTTIKSHACPQPCNLPCNGLSENCKYILWLPKPKTALKDSFQHTTQKAVLTLTDEKGTVLPVIDLTSVFQSTIDKVKLTETTFDKAIARLIDAINTKVAAAAPNFIGNNRPMFTYDADTPGKFQNETLNIERFTCQNLTFEIVANLTNTTQGQMSFLTFATYDTNKGNVYIRLQSDAQNFELNVPKFGCSNIDKCANTPPVPTCKDQPQLKAINVQQAPAGFIFNTDPGAPTFDKYFWYIHIGKPIYSTSATPTVTIIGSSSAVFVRVVAINSATGCYDIIEQTFNLG